MDSIIELLRKIKNLADRGAEGERMVAEKKLKYLMEKYGLSIEDLEDQTTEPVEFSYRNNFEKRLLFQCACYILQVNRLKYSSFERRRKIYLNLTKAQEIDLQNMYDHYRKELKKEMEILFKAFIYKHQIYHPDNRDNTDETRSSLTDEDVKRILNMIEGLGSRTWYGRRCIEAQSG